MNRLRLTTWQRRRLLRQLRQAQAVPVYRRTLAVLEFARGRPIAAIAEALGVSRQSVYNWLADFACAHDPAALLDEPRSGRPALWSEADRSLLAALLRHTPQQSGYLAVNWTVPLLREQLRLRTGRDFSDDTLRRELHRQGYAWKRPRYVLDPDPERDKKTAPPPADPGATAAQRPAG
jgi:transposase